MEGVDNFIDALEVEEGAAAAPAAEPADAPAAAAEGQKRQRDNNSSPKGEKRLKVESNDDQWNQLTDIWCRLIHIDVHKDHDTNYDSDIVNKFLPYNKYKKVSTYIYLHSRFTSDIFVLMSAAR